MVQKYLIAFLNDQVEKYFNYASQKSSFICFFLTITKIIFFLYFLFLLCHVELRQRIVGLRVLIYTTVTISINFDYRVA